MMIGKVVAAAAADALIDLTSHTLQSSNVSDLLILPQEWARIPTVAQNIFLIDTIRLDPPTKNFQIKATSEKNLERLFEDSYDSS